MVARYNIYSLVVVWVLNINFKYKVGPWYWVFILSWQTLWKAYHHSHSYHTFLLGPNLSGQLWWYFSREGKFLVKMILSQGVSRGVPVTEKPLEISVKTVRKFGKNRKTAHKWTKPRTVGMLGKPKNRTKNYLELQNRKPLTPNFTFKYFSWRPIGPIVGEYWLTKFNENKEGCFSVFRFSNRLLWEIPPLGGMSVGVCVCVYEYVCEYVIGCTPVYMWLCVFLRMCECACVSVCFCCWESCTYLLPIEWFSKWDLVF